jgi:hypothetical protein
MLMRQVQETRVQRVRTTVSLQVWRVADDRSAAAMGLDRAPCVVAGPE